MDTNNLRELGDNLHQALNDHDQLLIQTLKNVQDALAIRVTSQMKMRDGQRTIRYLCAHINSALEARDKLIAAHCSAENDRETMGWPEICPKAVLAERKTKEPA